MAGGVRERARAALLADVGRVARRHLAERGASELSVRAISRELDLAPSALYRYYPSRDALLTRLIIEAYDDMGAFVEAASDRLPATAARSRFLASCLAIREWAVDHPHEYALLYGSPVPGYAAPDDTIGPATRVIRRIIECIIEVDGKVLPPAARRPRDLQLERQVTQVVALTGEELDPDVLTYCVALWATLFGMVSFELFGTFTSTFDDGSHLYLHTVEGAASDLALDDD